MQDQDAPAARLLDDFVHARGHFRHALGRAFAPMLVPHVADHDGRPGWVPGDGLFDDLPLAAPFGGLHAAARGQEQGRGRFGGDSGQRGKEKRGRNA